jgi:ABC-type transport system involved in cytochrome c biogenesis permease subunit
VKKDLMFVKKVFLLLFSIFISSSAFAGLESLPVQHGGRVKPFDSFAREMLSLVYGKETYKDRTATEVVFSWLLIPQEWDNTEIVLVRHNGLREAMKLDHERLYYKPSELMANEHIGLLMQDLKNKRQAQEKLDPFYQAVETLENQLTAYQAVKSGMALAIAPVGENANWKNVTELPPELKEKFKAITDGYVQMAVKGNSTELDKAVQSYIGFIENETGSDYSHRNKIKAEVHYNSFHPFRWGWVAYFIALVFFAFAYFGQSEKWSKVGWSFTGLGFLSHIWGFALRIYILERAPVTNMFETVVWVALVALILATVLYRVSGSKLLPIAATMVTTLSLILCDVSSSVLDKTLSPLVPVLRDNFWLLTHVVIIVSSYAAFFLAFALGDILLVYFLRGEEKYKEQIQNGAQAIYRAIQVGVVLLASGVILGGIWADYSWGRFWGWDPKETWAFIALLGYLVVLHGRLVGLLKNFGLAASAVVAFSLVIMAWYGVNFVLGAGLHTYGFGAGGVEYVASFVGAHLLFVVYVTTLRQSRSKIAKPKSILR